MTKPTRPFTSERPVTGTVTNSDILNAFHDLSAHFREVKPPPRFTSEKTRAGAGGTVTNNDLLQTLNDLSATLREKMEGAGGKDETSTDPDPAREKVANLKSADPDADKLLLARQELCGHVWRPTGRRGSHSTCGGGSYAGRTPRLS